jgi:hypothetical protein
MITKQNETHQALMQAFIKQGVMTTPISGHQQMKAQHLNPFNKKEMKVHWVHQWFIQVEAYMETNAPPSSLMDSITNPKVN